MFISLQHFGVKAMCWSSEIGTKMSDKWVIIHMDLHKPNNKQVG